MRVNFLRFSTFAYLVLATGTPAYHFPEDCAEWQISVVSRIDTVHWIITQRHE